MLNNQTYHGERDLFTVAALICASLSIASLCFVVFSPFFGCLGILFALLAQRRNGRLTNESKMALGFAVFGLTAGLLLLTTALPDAWHSLVSGEYPAWMSQFNETLDSVSGNSVSGSVR